MRRSPSALGSLALVLGLRRVAPLVPASLVVVAARRARGRVLLDLDDHGVEIVGPIESGLPPSGCPDVQLADYAALVGAAIGIMLVGFAEGLGAAKTYAAREHYDIDANRELLGLGAANIGSGLCERDGRQRQPVQDRRQRLGAGARVADLRAGRAPR